MKLSTTLLCVALTGLISACATITSGTTQSLTVETPYVPNASCLLKDTRGGTWRVLSTPGTVEVKKGDGPMSISCRKTGHETTQIVVKEQFAGATLGNILMGGVIGIAVDAASGAAQDYPSVVQIWLKPTKFSSATSEKLWHEEKSKYEEAKTQPQQNAKSTGNFN